MEKLSLKVGQLHCESTAGVRIGRPRCRTPRLPTPDTSRSSFDGSDGAAFDTLRNDSPQNASMHSRAGIDSVQNDAFFHKPASQSHDYRGQMSNTPPYHTSDTQRPRLPPLKFLLGDKLASPPCTPTISSAPSHPMPREPVCNPDPYRPLSLYPNKKQRTDAFAPLSATSRLGSQLNSEFALSPIRSQSAQTQGNPSSRPRSPGVSSPLNTSGIHGHGDSFQTSLVLQPVVTMTAAPQPFEKQQQQTCELTRNDRDPMRRFSPIRDVSRALQPDHPQYAPESAASRQYHIAHDQRAQLHPQSSSRQYPPPAQEPFRTQYGERRQLTEFGPPNYQPSQPPDSLVSIPHEYNYPKTRKRSNLPKHSTEIMRSWFDQNIENPYPSEEQKAMFATATGISMTQVSNWFINHRRRCPELRDKRAERRKL